MKSHPFECFFRRMNIHLGRPSWLCFYLRRFHLFLFIVITIFVSSQCQGLNGPITVPPSLTPPPHRGAARQMYGSASLRQPGTSPIYLQNQPISGSKSTAVGKSSSSSGAKLPTSSPSPYSIRTHFQPVPPHPADYFSPPLSPYDLHQAIKSGFPIGIFNPAQYSMTPTYYRGVNSRHYSNNNRNKAKQRNSGANHGTHNIPQKNEHKTDSQHKMDGTNVGDDYDTEGRYYPNHGGYQDKQGVYHDQQGSYYDQHGRYHDDQDVYHGDPDNYHGNTGNYHGKQGDYHSNQGGYHGSQGDYHGNQGGYLGNQDLSIYQGNQGGYQGTQGGLNGYSGTNTAGYYNGGQHADFENYNSGGYSGDYSGSTNGGYNGGTINQKDQEGNISTGNQSWSDRTISSSRSVSLPNMGMMNLPRMDIGIDQGFIRGRGYAKDSNGLGKHRNHEARIYPSNTNSNGGITFMRNPDTEEAEFQNQEEPCPICEGGQFLCLSTCDCISSAERCDGQVDCNAQEDEQMCGEYLDGLRNKKCEQLKNHIICPRTGRCIKKEWLCDGDDDCGDFSDETHCGFSANCTADQFECNNGLCIPKTWLCDSDNDCKDGSDEHNCTKLGCNDNEFTCADGSCISLSFKCDHDPDCSDESDEDNCDKEPPLCNEGEFQCILPKCIKSEFRCDGDDDCGDWSDEDDCPKIPRNCGMGEFKCSSGKCIPYRFRCDKQADCEEQEDERNCDNYTTRNCTNDEFTCNNGTCILKTWVCDGFSDCPDEEDELDCELVCDDSKFPCTAPNDTRTIFCINRKHICDGQRDCPNGEDEKECPQRKECEKGSKCSQICVETNGQRGCSCLPGYKLAQDGTSCDDINECLFETDPVCSQTCNNTLGSFKCGCMTGYILRPDLRSCKALGAPPTLLFANREDIRQVSPSNLKYTVISKGLRNAIALDYHYEKNLLFWSDVSLDVIKVSYINGTGVKDIIKWGLESPGGIAMDWIHNLLFWTDSGTRRIEVSTLDGKERVTIVSDDLDKPRAVAVHPGDALLFWTDWGPSPKIEKAFMDGSFRKSIITESIFWPNGLTLDYTTKRIYWADAKHNVIETSFFDGTDRKKVISRGLPHPFALTIFEDAVYWTDWHTKSISSANKVTGAGLKIIHSNLRFPMDIHSYHPQRQPFFRNHCNGNNGGCSHLCLPNEKSFSCVCKLGQKLNPDGKTCQRPEKMLIFARKKDLRLKHIDSNALRQHDMVIPVDGIKSAVALDWDSKTDSLYWTDVARSTINRAYWNGSNQEIIIGNNIIYPAGLALDWVTDKLYWTDSGTSRIEVSKTDGSSRALLIWEGLEKPRDIVVDPVSGFMYWSDWGSKPCIARAAMDGTMRSVIISKNLTWPNGLAIDHVGGKLYWTDGGTKTIEYSNLDGTKRRTLLEGPALPHPFGLDVFGDSIFWTDWESMKIESAHKTTGQNRTVLVEFINGLMDVRVFHRTRINVKTACNNGKNGGCSHLCLLKPKGFSCACPIGIKLGSDGKTCANGPTNSLILAHRMDIRQISLDVPYVVDVVLPFPSFKSVVSIDVDKVNGELYWTDNAADVIQKSATDGKNLQTILKHELGMVDGIAVDSAGRKIYWTDGERNSIEVAELDGKNRRVLIWKDLDSPRAIALHYHHGLMFWSDWGKNAKIEVAHMDGTNRKPLITERLEWPNGLAIDRPAERIYWNDGKLQIIESSNLDGNDRKVILTEVPHPYSLVIVGTHIYWTDWKTQGLHRADKMNGTDRTVIRDHLEGLMDVKLVQGDNSTINACGSNNGGCSHLCLRNPTSFTCACPTALKMSNDNKICETTPENFLFFAARSSVGMISLTNPDFWDITLPIQNLDHAMDVDFHYKKKLLYFTDIGQNKVFSVNMQNMTDIKEEISDNVDTPSIAVDWLSNNLYWTDKGTKSIIVTKLGGKYKKTLIKTEVNDPRSIAVLPMKGYVFWADWGEPAKIERTYSDGTQRQVIVKENLGFPNGLAIDYKLKQIFWADAKNDKVEYCDFHGNNRVVLYPWDPSLKLTANPFGVTQYGNNVFWTDWYQKTVVKADRLNGGNPVVIRRNLEGALGIVAVSESRQGGWNPCSNENGFCSHFCFHRLSNYTCGCPDTPEDSSCKTVPSQWVSLNKLDYDDSDIEVDYEPNNADFDDPNNPNQSESATSSTLFYVMTLVPMLFIIALSIVLLVVTLLYRKNKKKYMYATGRNVMTFSNPNYYSNSNEQGGSAAAGHHDKKPFLWKRMKYDKSQERVYEEKAESASPEVVSLIPTVLTPSSSNCEAVTPEIERSPSVTPLHRIDSIQPIA